MRIHIICFACFLFSGLLSLSAQVSSPAVDILRDQLFVKVQNEMIGSVSVKTGLMTASTITTWIPYEGFTRISEEYFFTLAGFQDEALQAKLFHKKRNIMLAVGGTGCVLGLAGMMTPFIDDFSNWSTDFMWISAGLLTISTIPVFVAVFRPNWATVEIAIRVADVYNANLGASR
jgi:hypothetical protein